MLDNGKISLYVGYQIAGIDHSVQEHLFDFISVNQIDTITMKQIDTFIPALSNLLLMSLDNFSVANIDSEVISLPLQ